MNFKMALENGLPPKKACFTISMLEFPTAITIDSAKYQRNGELLNELVRLGLLTSKDTEAKAWAPFGLSASETKHPAKEYDLSEKGKLFVGKPKTGFSAMPGVSFCYGTYSIVDVVNFTEPADYEGQKISKVQFTYKTTDIAEWVKESAILQSNYNTIVKDLNSDKQPLEGKAVLVQTQKGWVIDKDM